MDKNIIIGVGLFILLSIMGIVFIIFSSIGDSIIPSKHDNYRVLASFNDISGITVGNKVSIAGVVVGNVDKIALDISANKARVYLSINKAYDTIPIDSTVSILTNGLLGNKYLSISLGIEEEYMQNDDEFYNTQSSVILENLISKFVTK